MKSSFEIALDKYHNDYLGAKVNVYNITDVSEVIKFECESKMHERFISNWCLENCQSKWYIVPTPGRLPNFVFFENKIEAALFRLLAE